MIKYIFSISEMKTLIYMCGGTHYKCGLFDVFDLAQDEYDYSCKSLIDKGVLYMENTKTIKIDRMFEELIKVIFSADYTFEREGFVCAMKDIIVCVEQDSRSQDIIKINPLPDLNTFKEYYETKDDEEFDLYVGARRRGTGNKKIMCVSNTFSDIKELMS